MEPEGQLLDWDALIAAAIRRELGFDCNVYQLNNYWYVESEFGKTRCKVVEDRTEQAEKLSRAVLRLKAKWEDL